MKVAIVYDRVNKFGGAEQVLLALHQIWPDAPLYTAVYNKKKASWANVFNVRTSFLQHIPFAKYHHELFPWLTPLGFELFNFDEFDVVISVTSAEAKSIITKPHTLHVCYCLTPTRYLWSGFQSYKKEPGLGLLSGISKKIFLLMYPMLKKWDSISAFRPDVYIAISNRVKERISKYYKTKVSCVIYPPVNTSLFTSVNTQSNKDKSFLLVSRLVSYKRIDLVIDACNKEEVPLIIIGDGKDYKRLKQKAGKTITFVTKKLTEKELATYYQNCLAFIFAGDEDFGIVAAEAQAAGKPVLCFKDSGMAEIIRPGITGELFTKQTVSSLVEVLKNFNPDKYDPIVCRKQASQFDIVRFKQQMKLFVDRTYKEYYALSAS